MSDYSKKKSSHPALSDSYSYLDTKHNTSIDVKSGTFTSHRELSEGTRPSTLDEESELSSSEKSPRNIKVETEIRVS